LSKSGEGVGQSGNKQAEEHNFWKHAIDLNHTKLNNEKEVQQV
jgi:hypothetical protein